MEAAPTRTSPGDDQLTDVHRRWAIGVLELDAAAPAVRLHALALRRIEADEFVLERLHDLSVRILGGGPDTVWSEDDFLLLEEIALEDCCRRVDELIQAFFTLDPGARLQQHTSLSNECSRFPVLRKRLEMLVPGLTVEPDLASEADADVRRLAEAVIRQFVAWPSEAAGMRRSLLRDVSREPKRWRRAAKQLFRRHPWTRQLGQPLLSGIEELNAASRRDKAHAMRSLTRTALPQSAPKPAREGSPSLRYILLGVCAAVLSRIFIVGMESERESRYTPPVNIHNYRGRGPEMPEISRELQRLLDEMDARRDTQGDGASLQHDADEFPGSRPETADHGEGPIQPPAGGEPSSQPVPEPPGSRPGF